MNLFSLVSDEFKKRYTSQTTTMMAENNTSILASITGGWLTPTSLFLLLNLVIGTIVLTSRFTNKKQLTRSDSPSVFDRVKSIKFTSYKFPQYQNNNNQQEEEETRTRTQNFQPDINQVDPNPNQTRIVRAPSILEPILERVKSINFSSMYTPPQQSYPDQTEPDSPSSSKPITHKRTKSEATSKKSTTRVKKSLKKSASEKMVKVVPDVDEIEIVEQRRPETARLERKVSSGDHAVDEKADDFINKFRRQLKLQRLDSLLRYKERLMGN